MSDLERPLTMIQSPTLQIKPVETNLDLWFVGPAQAHDGSIPTTPKEQSTHPDMEKTVKDNFNP